MELLEKDPLRGTGRTTRMLNAALEASMDDNVYVIYVVFPTEKEARIQQQKFEHPYGRPWFTSPMGKITFVDEHLFQKRGQIVSSSSRVFFDHSCILAKYAYDDSRVEEELWNN